MPSYTCHSHFELSVNFLSICWSFTKYTVLLERNVDDKMFHYLYLSELLSCIPTYMLTLHKRKSSNCTWGCPREAQRDVAEGIETTNIPSNVTHRSMMDFICPSFSACCCRMRCSLSARRDCHSSISWWVSTSWSISLISADCSLTWASTSCCRRM